MNHWDPLRTLHRDGYSRLYYIKKGEGVINISGREIVLGEGKLILIPRGSVFKVISCREIDHVWIHFDMKTRDGLPLFDLIRPDSHFREGDGVKELYLAQILENWNRPDKEDYLTCLPLLNLLLIPFLRESLPAAYADDLAGEGHWLFRALAYLNSRLEEDIRIDELARELGCHPTYFSNAFSKKFGISPRSYLIRRRIEQSQQLLWHSNIPVKEVAGQCGFGDIYYFYRCFKKLTGLTPGEYRQSGEPYQYEKIRFR